jgi:hypothetical protein
MALKVKADGTIVIKTDADAKAALKAFRELKAERDEIIERLDWQTLKRIWFRTRRRSRIT